MSKSSCGGTYTGVHMGIYREGRRARSEGYRRAERERGREKETKRERKRGRKRGGGGGGGRDLEGMERPRHDTETLTRTAKSRRIECLQDWIYGKDHP